MDDAVKKEILKQVETSKEALKSQFELFCETYTEMNSRLDLIIHLLLKY